MQARHLRGVVIAFAAAGLISPGAGAVLKKYVVHFTHMSNSTNVSPNPSVSPALGEPAALAVIEDSGPSPVLKRLFIVSDTSITTDVPELGGFIYTSRYQEQGPTGEFTGTGSTDTTIAWGLLTGWTISGSWWCHASPAFVCGLAGGQTDLESQDPGLDSAFYDVGTWTFHGTGWTSRPFLQRTHDEPGGNDSYWLRGALVTDGTVPALPAMGLAVLGGSLVLGSLAALRRRKR
jgi:hypothetical protein